MNVIEHVEEKICVNVVQKMWILEKYKLFKWLGPPVLKCAII